MCPPGLLALTALVRPAYWPSPPRLMGHTCFAVTYSPDNVKNTVEHAKSFKENKLDITEWQIINQTAAVLSPLAEASTILEGKHYPTSNLVLPYIYGSIAALAPDAATTQTWDNRLLLAKDLHEDVAHARKRLGLHIAMEARWVTNIDKENFGFCVLPHFLTLAYFHCQSHSLPQK